MTVGKQGAITITATDNHYHHHHPTPSIVPASVGLCPDMPGFSAGELGILRLRKSKQWYTVTVWNPLAAPPGGSPLRLAPSFLWSLEPGPLFGGSWWSGFLSLGISVPQLGTYFQDGRQLVIQGYFAHDGGLFAQVGERCEVSV